MQKANNTHSQIMGARSGYPNHFSPFPASFTVSFLTGENSCQKGLPRHSGLESAAETAAIGDLGVRRGLPETLLQRLHT